MFHETSLGNKVMLKSPNSEWCFDICSPSVKQKWQCALIYLGITHLFSETIPRWTLTAGSGSPHRRRWRVSWVAAAGSTSAGGRPGAAPGPGRPAVPAARTHWRWRRAGSGGEASALSWCNSRLNEVLWLFSERAATTSLALTLRPTIFTNISDKLINVTDAFPPPERQEG